MATPGSTTLYDTAATAAAERLKKERTYRSKVRWLLHQLDTYEYAPCPCACAAPTTHPLERIHIDIVGSMTQHVACIKRSVFVPFVPLLCRDRRAASW
jgi:hypothetical protein